MGKVFGHILPGVVMSGIGLWHLINHISLFFSLGPASYVAPAWFPPAPRPRVLRYLELIVMVAFSVYGVAAAMPLGGMSKPPPSSANDDFIPLNYHEHDVMFATVVVYATSALYLDRARVRGRRTLCMLLLAVVFAQELFIIRVHSTDHSGVEGQLHLLLQTIIAVCLATALLGAGFPQSFAVSLVRSSSITFQGVWLTVIGVKWIPSMVAKGCSIEFDVAEDSTMYRCYSEASEHHAKAVVNLQFGWCMALVTVFVVGLYSYLCKSYPAAAVEYGRLPPEEAADESDDIKAPYDNCKAAVRIGSGGNDVHDDEFTPTKIEV